jgi:hypothetical protein
LELPMDRLRQGAAVMRRAVNSASATPITPSLSFVLSFPTLISAGACEACRGRARSAASRRRSISASGGLGSCLTMPKKPTPSRLIPNRHYAAIAKCIHTWAALELIPKLKALTSLTNLYGAAASASKLNKFTGDIGGLNEQRNRLVHDNRFFKTKKIYRFEISAKSTLTFGMHEESYDELLQFQETTSAMLNKFESIGDSIRKEIYASRDKLPRLPASIHEHRPAPGGRSSSHAKRPPPPRS